MAAADEDYAWPDFDENTASALCYTSGTTGRPKGVLYSHRSTVLHAYAIALPDVLGLRAVDRILPVVPMFHVNAWGIPHGTALTGAGAGAARPAPGRRQHGRTAEPGARHRHLRRAHRLARPAAAPARQRRAAGRDQAHHDRRVRRPAAADRGVPRRVRRGGGARLGHDRTQPGGHLQRAQAGAARPGPGRGGAAHAEAGPRAARRGHEDRRCRGQGTALGRRGVRRPAGARPLGVQRLLRRRAGQRAGRRTAGSPPATSPPSTRTGSWRSPTAPRT